MGCGTVTRCRGPCINECPSSLSTDPIMKLPGGTTTISGPQLSSLFQPQQSRKLKPEPGLIQSAAPIVPTATRTSSQRDEIASFFGAGGGIDVELIWAATIATTSPPSELVTYGSCRPPVAAITSSRTLPSAMRRSRPGVRRCLANAAVNGLLAPLPSSA